MANRFIIFSARSGCSEISEFPQLSCSVKSPLQNSHRMTIDVVIKLAAATRKTHRQCCRLWARDSVYEVIYWLMRRRPSLIYDALLHGNREWMILLLHYNTAVTLTKHKHGRRILRAEVDQPATTDQLKPGREGTYENTLDYACVSSSVINVRLHRSIHRIFHLRHSIVSSFCQGKTFFITSWSPSNQSGKTARAVYSSWSERYFTCHTDRLLTYPGVSLLSVATQTSAWYYPLLI